MAKGLTSGYAPLGAMIASDRLMEPFLAAGASFLHGFTFAGHPVSCAVALANLDVFEGEHILQHVQSTRGRRSAARSTGSTTCRSSAMCAAPASSTGLSWSRTRRRDSPSTTTSPSGCCAGFLSGALFEAGLICRADDRGDPVVQLSPPLICGQEEIDFIASTLREVLSEAWRRL